jgi:hypothetical protein
MREDDQPTSELTCAKRFVQYGLSGKIGYNSPPFTLSRDPRFSVVIWQY